MNRLFACGLILFNLASAYVSAREPRSYVDPFIGTKLGRWFFFAPAATPFGLVKLGPDTTGYNGYAGGGNPTGYRYGDTTILGFSHLHDFQLGGVLLMPETGTLTTIPGADGQSIEGWRSEFDKNEEHAEPGYYRVYLKKYKTTVELTATPRVGVHRYTFPKDAPLARVIVDIGHALGEAGAFQSDDKAFGAVRSVFIERSGVSELHAAITIAPPYAEQAFTIYTVITFNRPFKNYGAYRGALQYPNRDLISGFGSGFYVEFDTTETHVIEARVAISLVNLEEAEGNRKSEVAGKSFEQIIEKARYSWDSLLGRVRIVDTRTDAEINKVKFYTALWHVLLGRGVSNDADGSYLDSCGKVCHIPKNNGELEYERYNTDALWGSFWNLNQVWSLIYPERMKSFAKFLLSVYDETGWLPDGFVASQRAPGMPSNQATPFLAAAIARDPSGFDNTKLWNAVWKNQNVWKGRPRYTGQEVLQGYLQLGYVPCDDVGYGPTGHTLEYSYEDWCAAQIAKKFGMVSEAGMLLKRSGNWRNIWDQHLLCFHPRYYNGQFYEPFDIDSEFSFAEGTARQYRWFVPSDTEGLIKLFGVSKFIGELENTFIQAERSDFGPTVDNNVAGYKLGYNHGNETDLQAAWLFSYAGRPDLSRKYVGEICKQFYGVTPDHGYGFGQDEDQGQLGAWFVLGAIGVFDVEGMTRSDGSASVLPPLFQRIEITSSLSCKLTLEVSRDVEDRNSGFHVFLNGNKVDGNAILLRDLWSGGSVSFR